VGSGDAVTASRLTGQRLTPEARERGGSPADVAREVAYLQAQDRVAGALGIRARSRGLTHSAVRAALEDTRDLSCMWCLRGTLHYVPTEDVAWLTALYGPAQIRGARRRHEQLGLTEGVLERGLTALRDALADGPRTRAEIATALTAARTGVEEKGQAVPHVIRAAVLRGWACLGPRVAGSQAYALTGDWIGPLEESDPEQGAAELARRYLRAFGPATEMDFRTWSGLPAGQARAALAAAGDKGEPAPAEDPADLVLLPAWDSILLAYEDRSTFIAPEHSELVRLQGGGVIRPTVLVRGRVAGTWSRKGGAATVEPFGDLAESHEEEVADVARFMAG
jgi:winged helix DNA-binding protein